MFEYRYRMKHISKGLAKRGKNWNSVIIIIVIIIIIILLLLIYIRCDLSSHDIDLKYSYVQKSKTPICNGNGLADCNSNSRRFNYRLEYRILTDMKTKINANCDNTFLK